MESTDRGRERAPGRRDRGRLALLPAAAFSGNAGVIIAQGAEIWADPLAFTIPAQGNISITTAFTSVPSNVIGHSGSRTTSYEQTASTDVSAASMAGATAKFEHWYYISGIDVAADTSAVGVVAIGDSITDGRGTDNNKNNRWTDVLAARLQANTATANVSMMNQGIGATNLLGSGGTAAQARFNRDVLGQSGVKYAIVFDGVNDIGGSADTDPAATTTLANMKAAYAGMISAAHNKGLLMYGATITPFGGSGYYSVRHETLRQDVNAYIESGVFDGVLDFDAALTDSGNPPKNAADLRHLDSGQSGGNDGLVAPGSNGLQADGRLDSSDFVHAVTRTKRRGSKALLTPGSSAVSRARGPRRRRL